MTKEIHYPFKPKSNAYLRPGQFFPIALSDGRYSCGRVLAIDRSVGYGARTDFLMGLVDWVSVTPPTHEAIAGAAVYEAFTAHIRTIAECGGEMLGVRPLDLDGIAAPTNNMSFGGAGRAVGRSERRFIEGDPPILINVLNIESPLTDDMLEAELAPDFRVQFNSMLSDHDFQRLAEWFEHYPHASLRAYGCYDGSITDLEFLRFFPKIRSFSADALYNSITSLDGLRHLSPELESLSLGETKKKLDLSILGRFTGLKKLYLNAQKKNLNVVSGLTSLEELVLTSVTLPDLSLLLPLRNLVGLDISLGGTKDLALLPRIGALRYLQLWMVKGLTDISAISEVRTLRYLFLQSLRRVVHLPDMRRLSELRRVHIESMKGLMDISPLESAPALRDLLLFDMSQIGVDQFNGLVGHPTLERAAIYLGSMKRNKAAKERLGLPEAERLSGNWRDV